MNIHALYALAHPVYDPLTQIVRDHFWRDGRFSLGLTVNIGQE